MDTWDTGVRCEWILGYTGEALNLDMIRNDTLPPCPSLSPPISCLRCLQMKQEQDAVYSRIMSQRFGGEDAPMAVSFREVDPFNLWIWIELYRPPSGAEQELLQVISYWGCNRLGWGEGRGCAGPGC